MVSPVGAAHMKGEAGAFESRPGHHRFLWARRGGCLSGASRFDGGSRVLGARTDRAHSLAQNARSLQLQRQRFRLS